MEAARKQGSEESPDAPVALVILTLVVYAAGFAMVAAWFALLLLDQPAHSAAPPATLNACSVCGTVDRVATVERSAPGLVGEQSEGFVVLLAQLGGLRGVRAPGHFYETAVVHDDGSVRIVRDGAEPQWKRGDRVRVVRGRVEPIAPIALSR